MVTLLRDFRGQVSWGRVCALAALIVAVWGEFKGADLEHLKLWLGVAVGNYGASKLTEVVSIIKGTVPPHASTGNGTRTQGGL